MPYCSKCGNYTEESTCPKCGQPMVSMNGAGTQAAPAFEMKWHKFLIYFALWASGVLNCMSGLGCFTLGSAGILLGILCVAMGVFAIYVRFQLAGFKAGAPSKLLILYGVNMAISLLSMIISGDFSQVTGLITTGVTIYLTNVYYTKRASMFVN